MSLSRCHLVRISLARIFVPSSMAALGMICFALCGCGDGGPVYPPPVAVSGKVVLNGQPLTGGTIRFVPADPIKALPGSSAVQSDGSFKVTTSKPDDGLVPGKYTVFFDPPVAADGSKSAAAVIIPEKYLSPALSGLGETIDKANSSLQITLK